MIYPKQLIEALILDAIGGYEMVKKNIHPCRASQIAILREACQTAKFDTTIINVVEALVIQMDLQAQGWFSESTSSQLATMLRRPVDAYKRLLELQLQQPETPILKPVDQKELSLDKIQEEAKQLLFFPKMLALPESNESSNCNSVND